MIVLLQFDLPNEELEKICASGLSGEDLAQAINEAAIYEDHLHGAWHFGDDRCSQLTDALDTLWKQKEIVK